MKFSVLVSLPRISYNPCITNPPWFPMPVELTGRVSLVARQDPASAKKLGIVITGNLQADDLVEVQNEGGCFWVEVHELRNDKGRSIGTSFNDGLRIIQSLLVQIAAQILEESSPYRNTLAAYDSPLIDSVLDDPPYGQKGFKS